MQIEQILGNHGRTPANNVTVATRLIPLADIGVNVDIELEKLCKATQRTDFSSVHRLPIVYQEQETRILREVTIAEDEWTKREQDAPADSSFWLMMIGCATYESSSGVIKGVTPFAADVQILDDCSWRPIQDDSNDVDGWRQFSREKGLARERSPNAKMCLVPVAINARAK
jgi:hypothetical protein